MTTSDWITLLGAIVAAISIVVSAAIAWIAVRLQSSLVEIQSRQAETQQKQKKEDTDKDLAAVAQALASTVDQAIMLSNPSEMATASSVVRGWVIRANELVHFGGNATWYLYYSLAKAYGFLWEIDQATTNWEKALDNADTGRSLFEVLENKASFHYDVGSIEEGRDCFSKAEAIVKKEFSGDLVPHRLSQALTERAWCEYHAGELNESVSIYAEAWQQSQTITSPWRKEAAALAVADSFRETFLQNQTRLPATVPPGLVFLAEGLWQQQAQQATVFAQKTAAQDRRAPIGPGLRPSRGRQARRVGRDSGAQGRVPKIVSKKRLEAIFRCP